MHWAYSVAVINLFFLQMVYIAVETGVSPLHRLNTRRRDADTSAMRLQQLVFELNRTLGVSSLYVETTRWRVALHFLVLGVGGVAELFFLWRACLVIRSLVAFDAHAYLTLRRTQVMNTALPKLIGVALFLVCAGLYFTSNVLTALGLGDPRMEHLGNKVRCGATWSLLVLGIYATAWLWYRLVLSRRDRRASCVAPLGAFPWVKLTLLIHRTTTSIPSPVDIIAQGILYTSAVLTTLSLCATVSSSFYSNPHAIMITSAILNIYTPFACFCVTWAINQRVRLRRRQEGETTTVLMPGEGGRPGRTVVLAPRDNPAHWRSDRMCSPATATGEVPSSRSILRRGSAMSRTSDGESVGGWRSHWGGVGIKVVKTVERDSLECEEGKEGSEMTAEEQDQPPPRRPSWMLQRGRGARGSKIGPDALYEDIVVDTSALEGLDAESTARECHLRARRLLTPLRFFKQVRRPPAAVEKLV